MSDLPRLTVTQEQIDRWDELYDGAPAERPPRELRLRLPERPTTPCPQVGMEVPDEKCSECDGTGVVPIPEGTRVEAGWWGGWELTSELKSGRRGATTRPAWHPVATATVDEIVRVPATAGPTSDPYWVVTLTDIQPANDYDDGQPV